MRDGASIVCPVRFTEALAVVVEAVVLVPAASRYVARNMALAVAKEPVGVQNRTEAFTAACDHVRMLPRNAHRLTA